MAKERLINTRFWNDGWVRSVNPLDRYLFLYLLTNEYTNISGIYELPIQTIAYGSGLDERDLKQTMLPRLEPKVFYKDGWVIIVKFPHYQRVRSDSVIIGIKRELEGVPNSIIEFAKERGYGDGLGIIPTSSHILNLTKLNFNNTTASPLDSRVKPKKKVMRTYDENSHYEEHSKDSDTLEPINKARPQTADAMKHLLTWAEGRRGAKFINVLKQYSAFKRAKNAGLTPPRLKKRWEELEVDDYWREKGFDWSNVVASFDKKQ